MRKNLIYALCLGVAVGAALFLYLQIESKAQSQEKLPPLKNPVLVVSKSKRELRVFDNGKLIKTYKIALGSNAAGDKRREGDEHTPEGEFEIAVKNPNSKFYLSLGLNYPTAEYAERGLREKVITGEEHRAILTALKNKQLPPQNTALGGEIYLHGGGTESDWTLGCVAFDAADIKELFDALAVGTKVIINP